MFFAGCSDDDDFAPVARNHGIDIFPPRLVKTRRLWLTQITAS